MPTGQRDASHARPGRYSSATNNSNRSMKCLKSSGKILQRNEPKLRMKSKNAMNASDGAVWCSRNKEVLQHFSTFDHMFTF